MNNETTASQPKSIGDDAQFLDWLKAWSHEYENRLRDSDVDDITKQVAAYIDSRAPADQASATIQAAPDLSSLRIHTGRDLQGAWLADQEKFVKLSDVEALLVATIQEPVMVAEPVAWYADTTYDLNEDKQGDWPVELRSHRAFVFGAKRPTSKWDWKPLGDLSKLAAPMVAEPVGKRVTLEELRAVICEDGKVGNYLALSIAEKVMKMLPASPMVADPAGVALLDSRFLHSKEIASDEPIVDSTRLSFWRQGWNAYRNALAATVKAVPSEALEDAGWFGSAETVPSSAAADHEAALEAGDFAEAARIRGNAAPLADKTGGGE